MRKMKLFVVVCAVFFGLLNGCKSDEQESASPSDEQESASPNVLNIIVILDTSNRVSPERQPDQIERDIEIVKEITAQFGKIVGGEGGHIDKAETLAYKDSLTVVVPNQPGVPSIPWEIIKKLTIEDPDPPRGHVSTDGPSGIFTDLKKQVKALPDEMSRLYEFVLQHPQTGSDIYEWFQFEAKDYFDEKKRNLIICLSDGYLNFDRRIEARRREGTFMKIGELRNDPNPEQKIRNGEGLKPIGKNFSRYNVKFLMLEIAPQSERDSGIPYQQDFDIIKAYWDTWLNSMGIKEVDFMKTGRSPINKIKSFISGEDGS